MLHCEQIAGNSFSAPQTQPYTVSEDTLITPPQTLGTEYLIVLGLNTEQTVYVYEQICRVCLKEGNLPIFGPEDLSDYLKTIAGVEVTFEDAYPKYLCPTCNSLLHAAILFRQTAQESDQVLKQPGYIDMPLMYSEGEDCRDEEQPRECKTENTIKIEKLVSEENKQMSVYCEKCDLSFDSLGPCNEHRLSEEHDTLRMIETKDMVKSDDSKQKGFCCKACDLAFDTLRQYKEHKLSKEHNTLRKTVALIDTKKIDNSDDSKQKGFCCKACDLAFDTLRQYKEHKLSKERNTLRKTVTFFDTKKMDKSDKSKQKALRCKPCHVAFESWGQYEEHRLSKHGNMHKRKTCTICNNSYSLNYFKNHMELHSKYGTNVKCRNKNRKGPPPPSICDICGKSFSTGTNCRNHRLTHFLELPFKCQLCPYRGRFSHSLKNHMRTHTGEKLYQCTHCPSRFAGKVNLKRHMLTHKMDREFKCNECYRDFHQKRDLELHVKVDHCGIKDEYCSICGKAFGLRKDMLMHERRVHKREKYRLCPLYLKAESQNQFEAK